MNLALRIRGERFWSAEPQVIVVRSDDHDLRSQARVGSFDHADDVRALAFDLDYIGLEVNLRFQSDRAAAASCGVLHRGQRSPASGEDRFAGVFADRSRRDACIEKIQIVLQARQAVVLEAALGAEKDDGGGALLASLERLVLYFETWLRELGKLAVRIVSIRTASQHQNDLSLH